MGNCTLHVRGSVTLTISLFQKVRSILLFLLSSAALPSTTIFDHLWPRDIVGATLTKSLAHEWSKISSMPHQDIHYIYCHHISKIKTRCQCHESNADKMTSFLLVVIGKKLRNFPKNKRACLPLFPIELGGWKNSSYKAKFSNVG